MAKATKGKGKKKSKGQKKEPSVTPADKKPKSPPQKKKVKAKFECQYCGKVVNNAHNLKVHEVHCKSKEEEKEKKAESKEIESAVRKLKDEFEDQTELIQKEASEREDGLRQELEELKDILRMEIQRGHHFPSHEAEKKPEPEPATDAEQPISQPPAAEPAQDPESTPQITAALPVEIEQPAPTQVDMPITQPEPEPAPPPSPPQDEPEMQPAVESPVSAHSSLQPSAPSSPQLSEIPEQPISEAEAMDPPSLQISREQVAEILKEEIEKMGPGPGMTPDTMPSDIIDRLESLDMKLKNLSSDVSRMNTQSDKLKDEIIKIIDDRFAIINPKRINREMEKMSERIFDVMDEVGFGESLNVSKIPPNILEIVYKATLEDLVKEMNNVLGQQDAERKINLALEEVRLKTSGSELFRFDGRRITTDNLARSLDSQLISAKQIQTTYSELLRKLLETVPNYKAKNFQAMIKIKSQEYAVDRATVLGTTIHMLESNMNNMGQMIAAFSSQLGAKALQLEGDIKQNSEIISSKSDKTDLEPIISDMMERAIADRESTERTEAIRAEIGMMKEMVEGLSKQLEEIGKAGKAPKPDTPPDVAKPDADKKPDKPVEKAPKKIDKPKKDDELKKPSKKEDKKPAKEKKEKPEPKPKPKDDAESRMLEAIAGGSSSKTALQKKLKLGKEEVETGLAELVKQKKVLKKGPKNRPTYHLPEDKPQEKKADKDRKPDKPKAEKKVGKSKEEPKPEPPVETPAETEEPKPAADKKAKDKPDKVKPGDKKEKKPSKPKAKKDTKPEAKKPGAKAEDKKPKPDDKPKKGKKPEKSEAKPEEKPDSKKTKAPKTPPKEPVKKDDKGKSEAKESDKEGTDATPAEEEKPLVKSLKELDEAETIVYNEITEAGITLPNLRKSVEKEVKYTAVLRALRVLIDSDLIIAASKGRHTVYKRINIKKMDKTGEKKDKQEVK